LHFCILSAFLCDCSSIWKLLVCMRGFIGLDMKFFEGA
jgi:hypothetical protein